MVQNVRSLVLFCATLLAGCCGNGDEPRADASLAPSASTRAVASSSASPASSQPVASIASRQIVWAPDATRFAYWTEGEHNVAIWDTQSMRRVAMLEVEDAPSPYKVLGWSPDGSRFVSHFYGSVFLWDTSSWKRLDKYTVYASNTSMAFSPDGSRLLISGAFGNLIMVDPRSGAKLRVQSMHHPAAALESRVWWSPDNETTVYADNSALVQLRNSHSGRARRTLRKAADDAPNLPVLAFSPSGGRMALMTEGDAIVLVRAGTGEEERRISTGTKVSAFHPSGPGALAFSPDGKLVAAITGDRAVRVWDVVSGAERATLQAPQKPESFELQDLLAFSSSGELLAWRASPKGAFGVWKTDGSVKPKVYRQGKPAGTDPSSIVWPPRGEGIVWQDGERVEFWSANEGTLLGSLPAKPEQCSFVPGTNVLAVAGERVLLRRVHDGASVTLTPSASGELLVEGAEGKQAAVSAVSQVFGRK